MRKNILIALLVLGLSVGWVASALAQDPKVFEKNVRIPGVSTAPRGIYFTELDPFVTGLANFRKSSAAFGDYDNDGDLDILMAGLVFGNNGWECTSKIYRSKDGNGTFTDINAPLIGVNFSSVAWGDYDKDGDLDVLLCGEDEDGTAVSKVYENQGEDVFAENPNAVLTGISNGAAVFGDYDNDGDLDILLSGAISASVGVSELYRNVGGGTFTPVEAGLMGFWDTSAAFGDYDNDGDLDILLSGSSNNENVCSKVYRNNHDDTFTSVGGFMFGAASGSVAWGDFDNDRDLDFLVTGTSVRIYRNIGNGSFVPTGSDYFPSSLSDSSASWGDCNNDGKLDVVLTGDIGQGMPEPICRVYLSYGGGFIDLQADLAGVYSGSASLGDYDDDGKLDILITGFPDMGQPHSTLLYQNLFASANNPPDAPENLVTSIGMYGIKFSWDKSSDDHTPQNGLTYNLFVGTEPGLGDIVSPMADISSGWRKVAAIGSQNENTSWTIKKPKPGKYFWGVQALDTAFGGSVFATGSFVVKPGIAPGPSPIPIGK